jgi:hypothetical protein
MAIAPRELKFCPLFLMSTKLTSSIFLLRYKISAVFIVQSVVFLVIIGLCSLLVLVCSLLQASVTSHGISSSRILLQLPLLHSSHPGNEAPSHCSGSHMPGNSFPQGNTKTHVPSGLPRSRSEDNLGISPPKSSFFSLSGLWNVPSHQPKIVNDDISTSSS